MLSLITAVIKPYALENVKEALKGAGVAGMTLTEVKGFGRQGGHTETYRGAEYAVEFIPKIRLEVLVPTEDADRLLGLIADSARTGQIGDGKLWITTVDRAVRVRTGEMGADAI
jgi:nitrogen regulatory protein P-II 1